MKDIRNLMRNLSDLHYKFVESDYELTALDRATIKQLIESLNLRLLLSDASSKTDREQELYNEQPFIDAPQPVDLIETVEDVLPVASDLNNSAISEVREPLQLDEITVDDLNQEMNEIFFPEVNPSKVGEKQLHHHQTSFQLGINERIMFARELFKNDISELQNSIRQLQSFQTKGEAQAYFEQQFYPLMIQQGKDEEILKEYEQIIDRLY